MGQGRDLFIRMINQNVRYKVSMNVVCSVLLLNSGLGTVFGLRPGLEHGFNAVHIKVVMREVSRSKIRLITFSAER
jgi:hypothetical protein